MTFSLSPADLIASLQTWPSEGLILLMLVSCGAILSLMARIFGALGLMLYITLAVIIANLQIHIATHFSFFHEPIALGTVVFSSTFIGTSILTEFYGKAQAQKAVWLSFVGVIILMIFMMITLGFKPAAGFGQAHQAIQTLFMPTPALITASLIAYVIGQYNDIWMFTFLSRLTRGKLLWLRSFVGPLVGAFMDNLVFSVLAWMVFSPHPLSWNTVFFTYVLGTYLLRIGMALISVPFMYVVRRMVR